MKYDPNKPLEETIAELLLIGRQIPPNTSMLGPLKEYFSNINSAELSLIISNIEDLKLLNSNSLEHRILSLCLNRTLTNKYTDEYNEIFSKDNELLTLKNDIYHISYLITEAQTDIFLTPQYYKSIEEILELPRVKSRIQQFRSNIQEFIDKISIIKVNTNLITVLHPKSDYIYLRVEVTLSYNNTKLALSYDKMNHVLYYSINDSETTPIQLDTILGGNSTFLVHLIAASLDLELPIVHEF
jgi:hypothetical protein